MSTALTHFHPLIQAWFKERFAAPTDIQEQAWPRIGSQEHLLITAPTGSGKTLTAFLWAIHQLASKAWEPGQTRVLYVSPLKALNNDIQENLIQPLAQIRERFESANIPIPDIRVMTRSGDTPQKDRRKMSLHPPEILITTPESLNLLLSSKSGRLILGGLRTVILDEIHACAGSKRGVHLITAVDRLVRLSGEFQRIALSATLRDLSPIAKMVGGYTMDGSHHAPVYTPRPVGLIRSKIQKTYDITVRFPKRTVEEEDLSIWDLLADAFKERIEKNRSTLLFTNGRRLCEKLTYKVNKTAGRLLAYSHHGSLSKDLRQEVEENLRIGELSAIIATSSLEMGIDIGNLDEVIMVQSPPAVSSAIQRLGRAGHQVGSPSRGCIFPAHAQDLIPSAVLARAVKSGDIEPITPVTCPLDVLAQILISMIGMETWDMDHLFAFIRTSTPFHDLPRQEFDLILNMLAGTYAQTKIRDLKPRVSIDRIDNTVAIKKGALLTLYMSGGTIPDRGYFQLRHDQTNARIGELDEEYVWEAKIGQIATVGSQNWKITRITHNDVFAQPAGSRGMDAPFWLAEGMNRDFHFSDLMGQFLEKTHHALAQKTGPKNPTPKEDQDAFFKDLVSNHCMDEAGANELIQFCRSQLEVSRLPHRHHLVLEYANAGPGSSPGSMLVIHTLWGGRVNRPFALALEAAWTEVFKEKPEVFPGNDAVIIQLPRPVKPEEIMGLVSMDNLERLVRTQLEASGFFGARFRECAGRALLVTRNRINQRMPLWMTRLHSQKLLENILSFPDFPILLETWRTCLKDEFDMAALGRVLEEVASGEITWSVARTSRPSPFAAAMAWNQINQYMYQEDQPASQPSSLKDSLIRSALYSDHLRPKISGELIEKFEFKRQRLAPGYSPNTPRDLMDWVKDRVAIPLEEWTALTRTLYGDLGKSQKEVDSLLNQIQTKLVLLTPGPLNSPLVTAREKIGLLCAAWYPKNTQITLTNMQGKAQAMDTEPGPSSNGDMGVALFLQWLGYYGPRSIEFCSTCLGLKKTLLDSFISCLIDTQALVSGSLVLKDPDDPGIQICDADNLERLIRMHRAAARPEFEPLDTTCLPLFIASIQSLTLPGETETHLFDTLGQLACLPLPAALWETDILPARIHPYHPSFLDSLMQEGQVQWMGRDKEKVLFFFEPDQDFLSQDPPFKTDENLNQLTRLFDSPGTRYDFSQLITITQKKASDLSDMVWGAVWKGQLTNETFMALRKGIENKFKVPDIAGKAQETNTGATKNIGNRSRTRHGRMGRPSRTGMSRWQGALPLGHWYPLRYQLNFDNSSPGESSTGPNNGSNNGPNLMELEEVNRDRVRLLMDRYGILFRELIARELPGFRWADIFKSLYLMELSGEILAGFFFTGIQGPQFISHTAFRKLKAGLNHDAVFWMNALDPASICGLGPLVKKLCLPKRLASNLLVYKGPVLVLVSQRRGRDLTIHVEPNDEFLPQYLAPLTHMMNRRFTPVTHITIEKINGETAVKSPYCDCLGSMFEVVAGHKTLELYQRVS